MNEKLFDAIRELNLPIDQYAITGSGPIGIRNLREIGDLDIIVTKELWDTLSKEYPIAKQEGVQKLQFPSGVVEALKEYPLEEGGPTNDERIAQAEIIEGLPFESLEHVLYFKNKMGRDKDQGDIQLIMEHFWDSSLCQF